MTCAYFGWALSELGPAFLLGCDISSMGVGGRDGMKLSSGPALAVMDSRQRRPPECGAWLYFSQRRLPNTDRRKRGKIGRRELGGGRPVTHPPEGKNCTLNPFDAPGIVPWGRVSDNVRYVCGPCPST